MNDLRCCFMANDSMSISCSWVTRQAVDSYRRDVVGILNTISV